MSHSGQMGGLAILLASVGFVYGGGSASSSDNFADGIRNQSLWQKERYTFGQLIETGGHLALSSGTIDPTGNTWARWTWRPQHVLINNDVLETEALVSMPNFSGVPAGGNCSIGIELWDPDAGHSLECLVFQPGSSRSLYVTTQKAGAGAIFLSYPIPTAATRFVLKVRYHNGTGKASFWMRTIRASVWTKIGAVNLRYRWGRAGFTTQALQPAVSGHTYLFALTPLNNVYLDNFAVSRTFTAP